MVVRVFGSAQIRRRALATPFVWAAAAFCIIVLATTFVKGDIVSIGVAFALTAAIIAAVYLRAVMTYQKLKAVLELCCVGSIFTLALAVIEKLTFIDLPYRCFSVYSNPNYYATMMEFIAVISVYLLVTRRKYRGLHLSLIHIYEEMLEWLNEKLER